MSFRALKYDAGPRVNSLAKYLKCRAPATAGPEYFTILSTKLRGLLVGTVGKRTQPVEDERDDAGIQRGSIRWEGYLHCKPFDASLDECILRITPQAGVPLRTMIDRGEIIRGLRVKFSRRGGHRNGMLIMQFGSPRYSSEILPAEVDVQLYTDRMFNMPLFRVPLTETVIDDRIASTM
jgi:hypothetical protein